MRLRRSSPNPPGNPRRMYDCPITDKQFACLKGTAEGKKRSQIAAELGISPNTVDSYLRYVKIKLGGQVTKKEMVLEARRRGLV